jgi:hypothetical protein
MFGLDSPLPLCRIFRINRAMSFLVLSSFRISEEIETVPYAEAPWVFTMVNTGCLYTVVGAQETSPAVDHWMRRVL